jgi:hypothetical protein
LAYFLYQNTGDLVILDIGLPKIDGWSVSRRIRKNSNIPIIMRIDELMNNKEEFNIIEKMLYMIPILFILAMFILHLTLPKKTFSIEEKRYLAQNPSIKLEEVLNGSYGTKIELYFSDQFPFRDFWVHIQEDSNQVLFKS